MKKNNIVFFLIIICLIIIIIIIVNQLQYNNCESFATPTLSLTTDSQQVHLTTDGKNIVYYMGNNTKSTTLSTTVSTTTPYAINIKYTKINSKNVMSFTTTSQIVLTRTANFTNGMTIFAVLQPTLNTNPNTGLINIPKKYTDNNYYPAPLLLYNNNYQFGNGTDSYSGFTYTGAKNFWSGNNNTNNSNQALQLYTLVITPTNDSKISVTEYINGKSVYSGTFDKYSDTATTYASIYIGNVNIGNTNIVYVGTLAELVIYNSGLLLDDINNNWKYLCTTWGIPVVKLN